jgi:acylphosphatase
MPEQDVLRVRATARGRVQMVGYRAFVQRHALDLGIRGEVRNRPDGSVEAVMEGSRAAVERLLDLMREGPMQARVTALDVREEPAAQQPLPDRMQVTA